MKLSFEKLELGKIIDMLKKNCVSKAGKEIAEKLKFSHSAEQICRWQRETTEAAEFLRLYPEVPLGGMKDIRDAVKRVSMGGILEPIDLLEISDVLRCARRLKGFISSIKEQDSFPILTAYVQRIVPQQELEKRINSAVTHEGQISDSASLELARIRRQINNLQQEVKDRLHEMIKSPELRKFLQEALVTVREGRYVVPVKAEYKSKIPGLIHDQSASGATIFVEPFTVVQLNNDIRSRKAEERNEINRILTELSREVRSRISEIEENINILAEIDFLFAKGKLSLDMDGISPKINKKGYLYIKGGRHPLIPKDKVVPITVYLGKDFKILLITGPNTGGKTVTLKTVGLLTLMAQCGLHIPAEPESEIAVFEKIFADIGDEQSIEQSLSTFSSHMKNIIDILPEVDERTLVLLDELGAGTDPSEGSALAMAVLEYLLQKNCRCVATTHYSELKTYAYVTDGIENASVEFDPKTLQPTYKLLIGIPGKSNAIDIAFKLGLDQRIIRRAREFLTKEEIQVSELIQSLEENRRSTHLARLRAEQLKNEAEEIKRILENKAAELERREREILSEAKREARRIVRDAQKQSRELLESLKTKLSEEAEMAQIRAEQETREKLSALGKKLAVGNGFSEMGLPDQKLDFVKPGDRVYVLRLNQVGTVLSDADSRGELLVQVGPMKINVKKSELRKTLTEDEKEEVQNFEYNNGPRNVLSRKDISPRLDLRGLTLEEAVLELDKYLDDVYLSGLKEVSIIHGKGTGSLRKGIRKYLEAHPQVSDFRPGNYREGGIGVTVVKLA